MTVRLEPYEEDEIASVPCFRCSKPSTFQWQICADGNQYRGVCLECDIGLNRAVLEYMRDPDVEAKIYAYKKGTTTMPTHDLVWVAIEEHGAVPLNRKLLITFKSPDGNEHLAHAYWHRLSTFWQSCATHWADMNLPEGYDNP